MVKPLTLSQTGDTTNTGWLVGLLATIAAAFGLKKSDK